MNQDYRYHVGEGVSYRGAVHSIIDREKGQFSGVPYYKVSQLGPWIREEQLGKIDPLAEWERALLAPQAYPIGTRVQMTSNNRVAVGTVVDYNDRTFPTYPGVKWDDMTHAMHYAPHNLELYKKAEPVEQIKGDDPRLDEFWVKAEAKARELGFCKEYDLISEELRKTEPEYYTTAVTVRIPVSLEVNVKVEVGKRPTDEQALEALRKMTFNEVETELAKRVPMGYWNRNNATVPATF